MSPVRIRPYEPGDVDALYEAALESIADVHPWLPWCHPGYARSDAEAFVARTVEGWRTRSEFEFLVHSNTGRYLGGCGLNQLNQNHRFANLGYWVRSTAMRSGVAPAAVRLAREWAFEHTELERLEIVVAVGNARSLRVAEKAGAALEGTLRARLRIHDQPSDAAMYSFVRADQRPGPAA